MAVDVLRTEIRAATPAAPPRRCRTTQPTEYVQTVVVVMMASLMIALLVAVAGQALDRPDGLARPTPGAQSWEPDATWCRLLNGKVYCYGEPN